jgi:hypothetical protein
MIKNGKKYRGEKKFKFFGSKIAIYLSLGLHEGPSSYRRKKSLHPSKENTVETGMICTRQWFNYD